MFRTLSTFHWDIKLLKAPCDRPYVHLRSFVVIIYKFIIGYRIKVSLNLLEWYVIEVEKKTNAIYMHCMPWFANKACACITMYENKYKDQLKLHVLVIDHENLLNDFFESEDIIKLIWRKAWYNPNLRHLYTMICERIIFHCCMEDPKI